MSENEPPAAGWGPPQTSPYGAPVGEPPPFGAVPYGVTPYPPPPPYGSPYPLPHEQGGANGFAVASLICGVLWLFWVGSVLAIVFGVIGLRQIEANRSGGKGLAITGIVLGALGLMLLVLALIGWAVDDGSSTTNALARAMISA